MGGWLERKVAIVSGGGTGMGGAAIDRDREAAEERVEAPPFLASDESSFVNGEQLFVDNGSMAA